MAAGGAGTLSAAIDATPFNKTAAATNNEPIMPGFDERRHSVMRADFTSLMVSH